MFMTKEGKLFGKVSIIDVFVIIAIIILAIGVYLQVISPAQRVVTEPSEIEYIMLVRAIRPATSDALRQSIRDEGLQRGGYISDARTGEELGVIVDVDPRPAYQEEAMADGSFGAFPVPGRYDVHVTVRIDGRVSETGFYTFQNRGLTMGSSSRFHSKYAATSGEIIAIRRVGDATGDVAEYN
ncbi:MAG: DUF4330 domain-containing protein [Oscillospiraceae bacterium]|nr:DUF4330 domain-containing protein [Oscillospiraceae bacterium]